MDLTLEAYRSIVKNVGSRADIATLCGVSQGFRRVAERALYNTLFMQNDAETILLCRTLSTTPRLAALVDALTILLADKDEDSSDTDEEGSGDEKPVVDQPAMDWRSVKSALMCTTQLRYLNVHINDGSSTSMAWVLEGCQFKLRRFHCDFDWDRFLVTFLSGQPELDDLYILDYRDAENAETAASPSPGPRSPSRSLALAPDAIPKLTTLECTFSEAAAAIVPGRPVSHLKTCFSRTEPIAKRTEMRALLSKLKLSTVPLVSLDLADSSYADKFSSELLASISTTKELMCELRHAGTFVLPVDGRERLQFYALLMRLPKIQCVELEVSDWDPPPSTGSALRALAAELRLYSSTIVRVVFVQDFDRMTVIVVDGICRVDRDINTELLWRER